MLGKKRINMLASNVWNVKVGVAETTSSEVDQVENKLSSTNVYDDRDKITSFNMLYMNL